MIETSIPTINQFHNIIKKLHRIYLLILFCSFLFFACSPDEEEPETTSPGYYFSAVFEGENIYVEADQGNIGNGAGAGGSALGDGYLEKQSMVISDVWDEIPYYGITFVKYFANNFDQDCTDYNQMIHLGEYDFGSFKSSEYPNGVNGVVITMAEPDRSVWSSSISLGPQSGSSLEIIEHSVHAGELAERISKVIFNCSLYNEDGDSQTLTNGEMRSRSVQCGL